MRGARAVATLLGADRNDPDVMAGATLVTIALVSMIPSHWTVTDG